MRAAAGPQFYFLGNCQLQFFARAIVRRRPGAVTCAGHAQVPYDCEPPDFAGARDVFEEARERRRRGGENILILQDTAKGKYTGAINDTRTALFDRVIRVPYVHFRSVWPNFRLDRARDFSARQLGRLFEVERIEFEETVARCGANDFDLDAHWRRALDTFEWYHPGHPTGPVFDRVFCAFLLPHLAGTGLDLAELAAEIAASQGLSFIVTHPIEAAYGDALGVAWHRLPTYLAWREMRQTTSPQDLQRYLDMAPQVARELGQGAFAAYLGDLGDRFKAIREVETAALLAKREALAAPGARLPLLRALTLNARLGRWGQVREVLAAYAPYLRPNVGNDDAIRAWLKVTRDPAAAARAVNAMIAEVPHTGWMRALVEERLTAG